MASLAKESAPIHVKKISGEAIATLEASLSWTGADVKNALKEHLQAKTDIDELCFANRVLPDAETLEDAGVKRDSVLQAVIRGLPTLHLVRPCSAIELTKRFGEYCVWDGSSICVEFPGHIVADRVQHQSLSSAPETAKEIVEDMIKRAPHWESKVIYVSQSDAPGEFFIIANPGVDPKRACLEAFAILEHPDGDPEGLEGSPNIHDLATVEDRDWNKYSHGFNEDSDDIPYYGDGSDEEILAVTEIMAQRLQKHFELGFGDGIVKAPIMFGGYSSDGSIVGVVSVRNVSC